jgi:hypothetical protein
MPASSAKQFVLENIRPRDIYRLLEIVHTATVRDASFVAARFAETAAHFEETLRFLRELGWLQFVGGRILPSNDIVSRVASATDSDRSGTLVPALFDALGGRARPFAKYLAQFQRREGELVHQPSSDQRLHESGPRNFLMELGAVTHQIKGDSYVLAEQFAEWALWGRNAISPSTSQLRSHLRNREEVGRGAELLVLDWEKRRVGEKLQTHVRHVSEHTPTACFDIRSITVAGSKTESRFIEVKAVSPDSYEFHWSQAEIEAAEILDARYFLYLVPVSGAGVYDLDRMEIIHDPYSTIYKNPTEWSTSATDVLCRRKERLDS